MATLTREEIDQAWEIARAADWGGQPSVRVAVREKLSPFIQYEADVRMPAMRVAEFRRKKELSEDGRLVRYSVECEGVLVDEHVEPVRNR